MAEKTRNQGSSFVERIRAYHNSRDEMNLVTLPYALLADRAPPGVNSAEYTITEYDAQRRRYEERKLTVLGDSKFGLPTASDERITQGLLHITNAYNGFAEPEVWFSRGELLETLGWKRRKQEYDRLTLGLDRLEGVSLLCENWWRDNSSKEYKTRERFGILDAYKLGDCRRRGEEFQEYASKIGACR